MTGTEKSRTPQGVLLFLPAERRAGTTAGAVSERHDDFAGHAVPVHVGERGGDVPEGIDRADVRRDLMAAEEGKMSSMTCWVG